MRPERIGRVLGIGLRVAGRVAGQRLSEAAQQKPAAAQPAAPGGPGPAVPSPAVPSPTASAPPAPAKARAAGSSRAGQGAARAAKGLGPAFLGLLRPFGRVGGTVALEVTGVFFLLFVLVFGQAAWRLRASYAAGPDHRAFLASVVMGTVFLYLTLSSFWRARRR